MFDDFLHQLVSGSLPSYGWRFNAGEHWKPWETCRMEDTRDEAHGRVQLHIDPTCVSRAWPDWGRLLQSVGAGTTGGTSKLHQQVASVLQLACSLCQVFSVGQLTV